MRSPAHILLDAVSRHYRAPSGTVRAVDAVTLSVEPGSSLAVTGPSGCGKSTLVALIGGLEVPSAGRVVIDGRVISSLSGRGRARIRREEFGLVFQSDNLLPFLTAAENVALRLAVSRRPDGLTSGIGLLGTLGMAEHADKFPDQLSGGQRQRVAVALAVVHGPRVLLADEPTGSLDAANAAGLVDLLLAVQHRVAATLVVVTHDPCVAARLDRTITLRAGTIVGDTDDRCPGTES